VTEISELGDIFADLGRSDSANIAYGMWIDGERYFVKGVRRGRAGSDAAVGELRNAVRVARRVSHPAMPQLEQVLASTTGPILVYRWVDGDLLGVRGLAHWRFRELPATDVLSALDTIYEVQALLAADGWIAVDFYDGSLIYDFATGRVSVIDFDLYRCGPFVNEMGRMYGSSRFMAPEEFELGAGIDQRTTVFVLGRTALVFLSDGTLQRHEFRGSDGLYNVVSRACRPDPVDRYPTVADFHAAWLAARIG
jgi:serine/threonine-protein kinase